MKKTTAKRCILAVVVLYPLSYLVLSLNGYFRPTTFGLGSTPSGEPVLRPKFGYTWMIAGGDYMSGSGMSRAVIILYCPLIAIDRTFWHTRERAEQMRYPIRDYYDREAGAYRDHEP